MRQFTWVFTVSIVLIFARSASAQPAEPDPRQQFLTFIRAQADELRSKDKAPQTRAEWEARRTDLRKQLLQAWGGFPTQPCPLEPKVLGRSDSP